MEFKVNAFYGVHNFVGKLELYIVSKLITHNNSFTLNSFKSHINDLGFKVKKTLKNHEYEIEL
jgi:hypothetical protein